MKIYLVGGAVRDRLMQRAVRDADYVVVGETPESMAALGFESIGKDFPTFILAYTDCGYTDLCGKTPPQYSLARRERNGDHYVYDPTVTLEEDLWKRDLTMNAMALDPNTNEIIDPGNGQQDIQDKILRHMGFFAFQEDPMRVLRVARFAARFPDFTIAPETMIRMCGAVNEGKLDNLVSERVWSELSRGLMEEKPSRMLRVLRECGALKVILPELDVLWGIPQPAAHHPEIDTGVHMEMVVDYAAYRQFSLPVRFAALMHDLGKGLSPKETWPAHHGHENAGDALVKKVCVRLRVPMTVMRTASLACRFHGLFADAMLLRSAKLAQALRACDAFRNAALLEDVLLACECDARGRGDTNTKKHREMVFEQYDYVRQMCDAAKKADVRSVVTRLGPEHPHLKDAIHAARANAIKHQIAQNKTKAV